MGKEDKRMGNKGGGRKNEGGRRGEREKEQGMIDGGREREREREGGREGDVYRRTRNAFLLLVLIELGLHL